MQKRKRDSYEKHKKFIHVDNFSVFSGVITSADKWDGTSDTSWYNDNDTEFTLNRAEQFAGFRDLVDGGNTFGGKTVTSTTSNGVTTYDLTGLTGEIKISVGSVLGKVDYIKFYK
jgi:hypothetical protein